MVNKTLYDQLHLCLPFVLHELIWNYLSLIHRDFIDTNDLGLVIRYKNEFDATFVSEICKKYGINIHACHPLKAKHIQSNIIIPYINRFERYVIKYKHYITDPHFLPRMLDISAMYYAIKYNDLTLLAKIRHIPMHCCNMRYVKTEALNVMYEKSDDKQEFCYQVLNHTRHFKWAHERYNELKSSLPLWIPFLSLDSIGYSEKPRSLYRFARYNTFDDFVKAHELFPHASLRFITTIAAERNHVKWFDYLLPFDPELNPAHIHWKTSTDECDPKRHLEDCLRQAHSYAMRKRICDLLQIKYQPCEEDILYYDNIFWFDPSYKLDPAMIVHCKSRGLRNLLVKQSKQYVFDWIDVPLRRSKRIQDRNDTKRLKTK